MEESMPNLATWTLKHPRMTMEHLGLLPSFFDLDDPRPAAQQVHERYSFAGGWKPFHGFKMGANGTLTYPGDPPMPVLAEATLRGETIRFYDCAWVAIVQPDGSFEISRLD